MSKSLFELVASQVAKNTAQPIARETVEIWDPIQKCKVIRYKDEILKELYKDLSIGVIQTMEYGA